MEDTKNITLFPYEIIGRDVEIVSARNKTMLGLQGKVIDETKMTLTIRPVIRSVPAVPRAKMILKNTVTVKITGNGLNGLVPGRSLVGRPEERIKWVN